MPATLGYWNIRGVGEQIRLIHIYLGLEFEDKRYNYGTTPETWFQEWAAAKYQLGLDFPNLPYYIDGDVKLSQSCTILRYIARRHNLLGETEQDKIRTDLIEQQCMDFRAGLTRLAYGPDFEKNLGPYLAALPDKLREYDAFLGGKHDWFGGSKVSFADFMMYTLLDVHRLLAPSCLDKYEHLKAFMLRFEALPRVSEYLKSDKYQKAALNGAMASWGGKPMK